MNIYKKNEIKLGTTFCIEKSFGTYLYPVTRPIDRYTLCVFLARKSSTCKKFPVIQTDKGNTLVYEQREIEKGKVYILPYCELEKYVNHCRNPICHNKVDSSTDETCPICHWVICSKCKTCGCPDSADYFNFSVVDMTEDESKLKYSHFLKPFNIEHCDLSLEVKNATSYIKANCRTYENPMTYFLDIIGFLIKHRVAIYIIIDGLTQYEEEGDIVSNVKNEFSYPEYIEPRIFISSRERNDVIATINNELLPKWLG